MRTVLVMLAQVVRERAGWFVLVVVLATAFGIALDEEAPGLDLYARDVLMRARGTAAPPDDIVIIAIDQPSISRLGQFPWNRKYFARILDAVSAAGPKAIALDVDFSEPTDAPADTAFAESVKRAGDVVLTERLIKMHGRSDHGRMVWMSSIPEIETSAAGVGHANLETEDDGTARRAALRLRDSEGDDHWALALEMVRVSQHLPSGNISQADQHVEVGARRLPFWNYESEQDAAERGDQSSTQEEPVPHMEIDYIGPTGSFSRRTVSFYDVLSGQVDPSSFKDKFVLVGVTAPAIGNRFSTPFVHSYDTNGDREDDLMPEVEVLANTLNTAVRGHFYHGLSDLTGTIAAVLAAIIAIFLVGLAEGQNEALRSVAFLLVLIIFVLVGSYELFRYASVFPPMIPVLGALAVAIPLSLLRRSLVASSYLDQQIDELSRSEHQLLRPAEQFGPDPYTETGNRFFKNGGRLFPRGIEAKTNALGTLSRSLIERSRFVDSALRSLEEGLLIAGDLGVITFANEKASQMLGVNRWQLIGSDLVDRLRDAAADGMELLEDLSIERLRSEREIVEKEIVLRSFPGNFVLRISPVAGGREFTDSLLGFVATLTDITFYRELQKTQDDVLTLVTHELRSPLTAIQGMSEVLAEHQVDADDTVKMASAINSEAKRLARLITEFLDLTKLESGSQTDRFSAVNLRSVLDKVRASYFPLATQRKITIESNYSDADPIVFANEQMLEVAFGNLVGNAIKYSPDNTTIRIDLSTPDSAAKVSVTDQGFGIESEQIPLIFEKFYRHRHVPDSDPPGSGLGLALTREIVELHGGQIDVVSTPGSGSTFTVSMPIAMKR